MKTFTCYDCPKTFAAASRHELLKLLYQHYMKEHQAIITGASEAEKSAWMQQFEKDWQVAPLV